MLLDFLNPAAVTLPIYDSMRTISPFNILLLLAKEIIMLYLQNYEGDVRTGVDSE